MFDPNATATDPLYTIIRDHEKNAGFKAHATQLWQNFEPFADKEFLNEIQRSFHQRFWEMYLGNALLNMGHSIRASEKNHGPDFLISVGEETIFVEAIAANKGNGADAPADVDEGMVEVVPGFRIGAVKALDDEGVLLRYQNGIDGKYKKFQGYVDAGIIGVNQPYVIALNGAGIPLDFVKDDPPRIIRALFGLGNEQFVVDASTGEILKATFAVRREIIKKSGSPVSMDIFSGSTHDGVSALMYSVVNVANYPERLGSDFVLVHNPNAKNPLPRGTFSVGTEYWVEGDQLKTVKY